MSKPNATDPRACTCGKAGRWHGIHMLGCPKHVSRDVSVSTINDATYGQFGVHVMVHAHGEVAGVMLTANEARAFAREVVRMADNVGASRPSVDGVRFNGMED